MRACPFKCCVCVRAKMPSKQAYTRVFSSAEHVRGEPLLTVCEDLLCLLKIGSRRGLFAGLTGCGLLGAGESAFVYNTLACLQKFALQLNLVHALKFPAVCHVLFYSILCFLPCPPSVFLLLLSYMCSLLASCRELSNHYTSCTSVTVLVASGILSVGHLGDSRAYLVYEIVPHNFCCPSCPLFLPFFSHFSLFAPSSSAFSSAREAVISYLFPVAVRPMIVCFLCGDLLPAHLPTI